MSKQTLYLTTNQQYGSGFILNTNQDVPLYKDVIESQYDMEKFLRHYKNQTIAKQFSKFDDSNLNEVDKEKRKLDRNVVVAKQFPVRANQIAYPQQGLNIGNVLYNTESKNIGGLQPTEFELPNRFYPKDCSYTKSYQGINYKFNGLNTVKPKHLVNNKLDEI